MAEIANSSMNTRTKQTSYSLPTENPHLKKILQQRCLNFVSSSILISSIHRHTPTYTIVWFHTHIHECTHTCTNPSFHPLTHTCTHTVINHLNTVKICTNLKSIEPPTSSSSFSFTTLCGFWLSQPGHSKPLLSNFSHFTFISLHISPSHLSLGLPVCQQPNCFPF